MVAFLSIPTMSTPQKKGIDFLKKIQDSLNLSKIADSILERKKQDMDKTSTLKGNSLVYLVCALIPSIILTVLSFLFDKDALLGMFDNGYKDVELLIIATSLAAAVQLVKLMSIGQLVVWWKKQKESHFKMMLGLSIIGVTATMFLNCKSDDAARARIALPSYYSVDSIRAEYAVLNESIRSKYDQDINKVSGVYDLVVSQSESEKNKFLKNKKSTIDFYKKEGNKSNIAYVSKKLTQSEKDLSLAIIGSKKESAKSLDKMTATKLAKLAYQDTLLSIAIKTALSANEKMEAEYHSTLSEKSSNLFWLNMGVNIFQIVLVCLYSQYVVLVRKEEKTKKQKEAEKEKELQKQKDEMEQKLEIERIRLQKESEIILQKHKEQKLAEIEKQKLQNAKAKEDQEHRIKMKQMEIEAAKAKTAKVAKVLSPLRSSNSIQKQKKAKAKTAKAKNEGSYIALEVDGKSLTKKDIQGRFSSYKNIAKKATENNEPVSDNTLEKIKYWGDLLKQIKELEGKRANHKV